ncbi:uncharacterized protein LOC132750817 [Ruditapes philippinarum]|uniref:uncharacterized protein LOC132750817 n=1 Tax=Ruditapes philippinarum TaxID=129788 RepID=UPI00295AF3A1|nr:uncharacterized protein LOC132750817 [Ruditapes philippinarum]
MDLVLTILMLTSVTYVTAVTLECPANLDSGQNVRHFGTHCYEFILNHPVDWFHADNDCRSKRGYLVDIHSQSEQAFIYNTLQILGLHGDKGVWIGLTDKDKEGTWKWTSGTNVNYKNWAAGQPGLFGGSEDCALLEKNGHWGDYPCSGIFLLRQNHGWICKYAEVPLTTKVMTTTSPTTTTTQTSSTNKMSSTLMSTLKSSTPLSTMTSPTVLSTISSTPMEIMTSPTVSSTISSTPMEIMTSPTVLSTKSSSTLKIVMSSTHIETMTMMSSPALSTKSSTTSMETKMSSAAPVMLSSPTDTNTSSMTMPVTGMMSSTLSNAMISSKTSSSAK